MKQKITQNWDAIEASGFSKKQKKCGPFLSRQKGEQPKNERRSKIVSKMREQIAAARGEKRALIEAPSPELKQDKRGEFYFQPRIGGKFGPRMKVSNTLAAKL